MQKIQVVRKGRFTLRGYGQPMADGQFSAVFTITERVLAEDVDMKVATGQLFDTEIAAADAGLKAAIEWVGEHRSTA